MRAITHPEAERFELPGLLHALSDPVRLQIVLALADCDEVSSGGLEVPVSKSTLSHHLKVLREAGLTRTRSEGVLRRDDVESRFPGLLACVLVHAEPGADAD